MQRVMRAIQAPAFRTVFLLAAFLAAVFAVVKNWEDVSASLASLPAWQVAAQVLLGFFYVYLTMVSWRAVLNDVGERVAPPVAARIFFSSQIAKYLPGGVWNFVAAAEVGKSYSISRRRSVCALVVSIMISIVTGMVLALMAILMGPSQVGERYWWISIFIPIGLLILCPPILNRLVNFVLKLIRRDPLESGLTWKGTLQASIWAFAAWLVIGFQLWMILVSLGMTASGATFLLATGGYALGWTAGFLVFFVPAGVGVREVALGAVLSTVISSGAVVVVVLLARVFTTLADIGWGLSASFRMRNDAISTSGESTDPDGSTVETE